MVKNGNGNNGSGNGNGKLDFATGVSDQTLRNFAGELRMFQDAVQKTQEENRRLGIPNWYQIDGKIVSDIQIAAIKNGRK